MTDKKTYYGFASGEVHIYDDPDECAQDFVDNHDNQAVGETFEISAGEGSPAKGSSYLDSISDGLTNGAYSELSEGTEDWCYDIDKIADELQEAVEKAVDEILDKRNLQPTFCTLKTLPGLMYRRTADGVERVPQQQGSND